VMAPLRKRHGPRRGACLRKALAQRLAATDSARYVMVADPARRARASVGRIDRALWDPASSCTQPFSGLSSWSMRRCEDGLSKLPPARLRHAGDHLRRVRAAARPPQHGSKRSS
jgi:hypothetical protein